MKKTHRTPLKPRDTVFATLYRPNELPVHGGVPISEISRFEVTLAPNAEYKAKLEQGVVPIGFNPDGSGWWCWVKSPSGKFMKHKGELHGIAELPSFDPEYLELLIARGWKLKPDFLAEYAPELLPQLLEA